MTPLHLVTRRLSPGFVAVGLRGHHVPTGHVLNIDHFHMAQPTFPPHPHAGFSAVTYMLEDSAGGFVNRDSRGDRSRIVPGALHWTRAGAGVVHEEVPEVRGVDCHGLQIFVKLPREYEEVAPAAYHLAPGDVPEVAGSGARVRVLAGALAGVTSPIPSLDGTTLLDVQLSAGARLELAVPAGREAFALVLAGAGRIGRVAVDRDDALALASPASVDLAADVGLQLLLGHSPPLADAVHWSGPFCMTDPARLLAAHRRYEAGAMGRLDPSF
jgi:hypothetical protein